MESKVPDSTSQNNSMRLSNQFLSSLSGIKVDAKSKIRFLNSLQLQKRGDQPTVMLERLEHHLSFPYIKELRKHKSLKVLRSEYRPKPKRKKQLFRIVDKKTYEERIKALEAKKRVFVTSSNKSKISSQKMVGEVLKKCPSSPKSKKIAEIVTKKIQINREGNSGLKKLEEDHCGLECQSLKQKVDAVLNRESQLKDIEDMSRDKVKSKQPADAPKAKHIIDSLSSKVTAEDRQTNKLQNLKSENGTSNCGANVAIPEPSQLLELNEPATGSMVKAGDSSPIRNSNKRTIASPLSNPSPDSSSSATDGNKGFATSMNESRCSGFNSSESCDSTMPEITLNEPSSHSQKSTLHKRELQLKRKRKQRIQDSKIPKIVLYLKGDGPYKQYRCAHNVDIKCERKRNSLSGQHLFTKENSRSAESRREAELFGEDSDSKSEDTKSTNSNGSISKKKQIPEETDPLSITEADLLPMLNKNYEIEYNDGYSTSERGSPRSDQSISDSLPDLETLSANEDDDCIANKISATLTQPATDEATKNHVVISISEESRHEKSPCREEGIEGIKKEGLSLQRLKSNITVTTDPNSTEPVLRQNSRKGKGFYDENIPQFLLEQDDAEHLYPKTRMHIAGEHNPYERTGRMDYGNNSRSLKNTILAEDSVNVCTTDVSSEKMIELGMRNSSQSVDKYEDHISDKEKIIKTDGAVFVEQSKISANFHEYAISKYHNVTVGHVGDRQSPTHALMKSTKCMYIKKPQHAETVNAAEQLKKSLLRNSTFSHMKIKDKPTNSRRRSLSIDSMLSLFKVKIDNSFRHSSRRSYSMPNLCIFQSRVTTDISELSDPCSVAVSRHTTQSRFLNNVRRASKVSDNLSFSGVEYNLLLTEHSSGVYQEPDRIHWTHHPSDKNGCNSETTNNHTYDTDISSDVSDDSLPDKNEDNSELSHWRAHNKCISSVSFKNDETVPYDPHYDEVWGERAKKRKLKFEKKLWKKREMRRRKKYLIGYDGRTDEDGKDAAENLSSLKERKAKRKDSRKSSRDEEYESVCDVVEQRHRNFHERDRGNRLAQEIPGFNWLEEKILKSSVPPPAALSATSSISSSAISTSSVIEKTLSSDKLPSRTLPYPSETLTRGIAKPLPALIPSNEFILAEMPSDSLPSSQNNRDERKQQSDISDDRVVAEYPSSEDLNRKTLSQSDTCQKGLSSVNANTVRVIKQCSEQAQNSKIIIKKTLETKEAASSNGLHKRKSEETDTSQKRIAPLVQEVTQSIQTVKSPWTRDPDLRIAEEKAGTQENPIPTSPKRFHLQAAVPPLIPTSRVTPLLKRRVSHNQECNSSSLLHSTPNMLELTKPSIQSLNNSACHNVDNKCQSMSYISSKKTEDLQNPSHGSSDALTQRLNGNPQPQYKLSDYPPNAMSQKPVVLQNIPSHKKTVTSPTNAQSNLVTLKRETISQSLLSSSQCQLPCHLDNHYGHPKLLSSDSHVTSNSCHNLPSSVISNQNTQSPASGETYPTSKIAKSSANPQLSISPNIRREGQKVISTRIENGTDEVKHSSDNDVVRVKHPPPQISYGETGMNKAVISTSSNDNSFSSGQQHSFAQQAAKSAASLCSVTKYYEKVENVNSRDFVQSVSKSDELQEPGRQNMSVSQKLTILTNAFKSKLNTSLGMAASETEVELNTEKVQTEQFETSKAEKASKDNESPVCDDRVIKESCDNKKAKEISTPPTTSLSQRDNESPVLEIAEGNDEEKPILISIPDTLPSFANVLNGIRLNDSVQQNMFERETRKESELSNSLIAALYEELMRTRQEVEKLRKVQEQMLLNSDKYEKKQLPMDNPKGNDANSSSTEYSSANAKEPPPVIDISSSDPPSTDNKESQQKDVHMNRASHLKNDKDMKFRYEGDDRYKRSVPHHEHSLAPRKFLKSDDEVYNSTDKNTNMRFKLPEDSISSSKSRDTNNMKLRSLLGISNHELDVVPVDESFEIKSQKEGQTKDNADSQTIHKSEIVSSISHDIECEGNNLQKQVESVIPEKSNFHYSLSELPNLIPSNNPSSSIRHYHAANEQLYQESDLMKLVVGQRTIMKPSTTAASSYEPVRTYPIKERPYQLNAPKPDLLSVSEPQPLVNHHVVPVLAQSHANYATETKTYPFRQQRILNILMDEGQKGAALQFNREMETRQANLGGLGSGSKVLPHAAQTFQPKILFPPTSMDVVNAPPSDWHHPELSEAHAQVKATHSQIPPHSTISYTSVSQRPSAFSANQNYLYRHPSGLPRLAEIIPVTSKPLSSSESKQAKPFTTLHQIRQDPVSQMPQIGPNSTTSNSLVSVSSPLLQSGHQIYLTSQVQLHNSPIVHPFPVLHSQATNQPPTSNQSQITQHRQIAVSRPSALHESLKNSYQHTNPPQVLHHRPPHPSNLPHANSMVHPAFVAPQSNIAHRLPTTNRVSPSHRISPQHDRTAVVANVSPAQIASQQNQLNQAQYLNPSPPHPLPPNFQHPGQPRLPPPPPYPHQFAGNTAAHKVKISDHVIRAQVQQVEKTNNDIAEQQNQAKEASSPLSSSKKKCLMCPQNAQFLCSGCKTAWYCSKECQREHWTTHSPSCVVRR